MTVEMLEYLDSLSPVSMEEVYEFEEYWRKNEALKYLWWLKIEAHKARSSGDDKQESCLLCHL
jgi:hypothetical protein